VHVWAPRGFLTAQRSHPFENRPAEFGKFIADETEKLGKVVKFAGIKLE
jgi:hypothetical protein